MEGFVIAVTEKEISTKIIGGLTKNKKIICL
jgi:hypothetical protein